jgi:uncharacterized protein
MGDPRAPTDFESLDGHKYCQLVTFRRNGVAMPTPVWFAPAGRRLYVKTESPSGKLRRIRNDPRVEVAPCTVAGRRLGPPVEGQARVLEVREEPVAEHALRDRYGVGRRIFGLLVEPVLRRRGLASVYLEIVPTGSGA